MKFDIKCRLPEWISFSQAHLHVFDRLPPPRVTQTSRPAFQKLSTDTFTASGWLLDRSTKLSHIAKWGEKRKKTQRGSYMGIAHACRHFSCCFAVKSFRPGIKSSFWKWDDGSVGPDLCFCEQGYQDGGKRRQAGKIRVVFVCTKHKCGTENATDHIRVYNRELLACLGMAV